MLNEMMGDPEKDYIVHYWLFDCDEEDFYSGYMYQVNCPKCLKRISEMKSELPFTDTSATPEDDTAAYHGQVDAV